MAKTMPPGVANVAGQSFVANVVPDVFDDRDLQYRPQLRPLPAVQDSRPDQHEVLTQTGNSCTGHAVAAMINTVLAGESDPIRVSPYMLYRMGRRYDEFYGDEDEGSSLRGALKGWFYHGVVSVNDWPSLSEEKDIDLDQDLAERARRHPLGAFYRVNAFSLDDVQSAVNELHAIVASALIHSGWNVPARVRKADGSELQIIDRRADVTLLGGHAFAIVGYNDIGFLVQNSWGKRWGAHGFATLPYEDWLASAYDAWVARPGVPSVLNVRANTKMVTTTMGAVGQGSGPDLDRLKGHVVNVGTEGRLATKGRFVSSPAQVGYVVERMRERHTLWRSSADPGRQAAPDRVVLYASGGLSGRNDGLGIAQSQLNWWLNNHVYPITFAWQSGPAESLVAQLGDVLHGNVVFGGLGFDLVEQADRFAENAARSRLGWMWAQLKDQAEAACRPLPDPVAGPAGRSSTGTPVEDMPAASLMVDALRQYAVGRQLEVHVVAHSAGTIFSANLLGRLIDEGIAVASVSWLAPAIRVDEFERLVLHRLRDGTLRRFTVFGLQDVAELNDYVGSAPQRYYQKSLLYLISRALESRGQGEVEVPLLGLQRHSDGPLGNTSVREAIESVGGELIWSPSDGGATGGSGATSHAGFDEDSQTMTSVMLRILGRTEPSASETFRAYAPQDASPDRLHGDIRPVSTESVGEEPLLTIGGPQSTPGTGPEPADGAGPGPVARGKGGSVVEALLSRGWLPVDDDSP
jgi:hypothetical protein